MTWTDIPRAEAGGTIGANDNWKWNDYLVNNIKHLKGQAGTLTLEDEVNFDNDGAFGPRLTGVWAQIKMGPNDGIEYDRALNQFNFYSDGVIVATLDEDRFYYPVTGFYSMDAGNGANRHIESGASAASMLANGSYSEDTFTFIKPFSAAPNVTTGHMSSNASSYQSVRVHIKYGSVSTTGVTLVKYNASAVPSVMTAYFLAEGAS